MIDDFKFVLLEKSRFEKESVNFNKYKVLLDILTSSPEHIIDKLNTEEKQQDFLSLVLLIDIHKNHDMKSDELGTIKDAFSITSSIKNKKLSESIFFNNPHIIKNFLDTVDSRVAARFIVEFQYDMETLVRYFIDMDQKKLQDILCAEWKKEEEQKSTSKDSQATNAKPWLTKTNSQNKTVTKPQGPIMSAPIVFDFIINSFIKNKDKSLLFFTESLSDERFLELIMYVFSNEKNINQQNLDIFFDLLKFFYKSELKNLFFSKLQLLSKNSSQQNKILGWFLSNAGFKPKSSEKSSTSTVTQPEELNQNVDRFVGNDKNHEAADIFPLNNGSAQERLTRLFGF